MSTDFRACLPRRQGMSRAPFPALITSALDARPEDGRLAIERCLLSVLALRREDATICPSDVARAIDPAGWRALMAPIRTVARRLASAGIVAITQHGEALAPDAEWRGPIRLRRGTGWHERST